jgi:truncated hemoglobin YjbI
VSSNAVPRHDGKILLVADEGIKSGEDMTRSEVDERVSDFYTGIGGAAFFQALTGQFYALVAEDDLLAPLFAVPDWTRHAARLARHYIQLYGENDLTVAWEPRLHQAHSHFLITRDQRLRWLALMQEAGSRLSAPEPHFTEFMMIQKIASGEMMAVSRGAAIARGQRFHWNGTPR